MRRKKKARKAEPPSKRGIAWPRWTGFRGKTAWDWLQLLIVPLALALIVVVWSTVQEGASQQRIEAQRAEAERVFAVQRAQDEALQAYLDVMKELLLEQDLRDSGPYSNARAVAQVQTLLILEQVDPARKTEVLRFLIEASLVQVEKCCKEPVIDLNRAALSDINLRYARLDRAHLNSADLSSANLRSAELAYAHLEAAHLTGADLSGADLSGADIDYAGLRGADLSSADLSNADLSSANLSSADLSSADLGGAKGVTQERLEAQARTLSGATMPDGQKMPLEPELLKPGPISPGEYVTAKFEPAFRYEVGEGWVALDQEMVHWLGIRPSEGSELTFTSPLHVFDPSNPSEPKEVPAPQEVDKWVSWFQSHPNLDTSKPVPVSVGGTSGIQIDVTTTSALENYPQEQCIQPCVLLYPASESEIASYEGSKDRFIIVDVGGETVVIDVSAPADKLEEFAPVAQNVLDTVEWESE